MTEFWKSNLAIEKRVWIDISFAFLIANLWLCTHRYLGIIGDGRLYAVQALNAINPGRFSQDLYFKYGSQDQFTLFTFIYKACIQFFGLAASGIGLILVAHFLWVSSLVYLARALIQYKLLALFSVATAILLPGSPVFPYGEAVLTPRLFSEALTMFALGALLHRKILRTILLLGVSLPIHPLMTIPGLAVLFVHQTARHRLWGLAAVACFVVCLALAFLGREPFVRLTSTFDPEWLSIVALRDYFCFITKWGIADWLKIFTTLPLTVYFLIVTEGHMRRFLFEVFVVAIGAMLVTLIGGDLLHNIFIVDIQPWRATWLLSVVTYLLIVPVVFRLKDIRLSSNSRLAAFLLIVTALLIGLSQFVAPVAFCASALAIITGSVGTWEAVSGRAVPWLPRIAIVALIGAATGFAAVFLFWMFFAFDIPKNELLELAVTLGLTAASMGAIVILLVFVPNHSTRSVVPASVACLALALVVASALNWDQRPPWTKFVETAQAPPDLLLSLLPPKESVYWEGDVRAPWFLLRRASYFSCEQGTGVLFSRGTAIEYGRRHDAIEPLDTADFGRFDYCPAEGTPPVKRLKALQRDDLSSVCRQQPGLDKLVLLNPVEGVTGAVWKTPVEFGGRILDAGDLAQLSSDRFFIYACADFR